METITKDECCATFCNHKEKVDSIKSKMVSREKLFTLSELFKVLGDHTRMRILYALLESELCVCDLSGLLDMKQSAISHQLRVLRIAKVVKFRKEGKNVFYSLDDGHIVSLLNVGMTHIDE